MPGPADRGGDQLPSRLSAWPGVEILPGPRRELRAWIGLAALAIGLAGLGAGLIAAAKTPGVAARAPWLAALFEKGLVVHVVFSFVVWFLAVFGGFSRLASFTLSGLAPDRGWRGGMAVGLAFVACALLAAGALSSGTEASLNNYVPVVIHPAFYAGLAILGLAVAWAVVRLFLDMARAPRPIDPVSAGVAATGLVFLIAVLCIALAASRLYGEELSPAWPAWNEDLFWGGGHILQFMNVGLAITAWQLLGAASLGELAVGSRLAGVAFALLVAFAGLGPLLLLGLEPFAIRQTAAFTDLQYLLALPIVLVLGSIGAAIATAARAGELPWRDPAFLALALSTTVFTVGAAMGLFADGADTRTPAHYHGVIAGMQLAFMGVFHSHFLPLIGRPTGGAMVRAQIGLFAAGQLTAALGLFIAAAPRKTAGAGTESLSQLIGFALNGAGGLVAIAGGALFAWTLARALLGPATPAPRPPDGAE